MDVTSILRSPRDPRHRSTLSSIFNSPTVMTPPPASPVHDSLHSSSMRNLHDTIARLPPADAAARIPELTLALETERRTLVAQLEAVLRADRDRLTAAAARIENVKTALDTGSSALITAVTSADAGASQFTDTETTAIAAASNSASNLHLCLSVLSDLSAVQATVQAFDELVAANPDPPLAQLTAIGIRIAAAARVHAQLQRSAAGAAEHSVRLLATPPFNRLGDVVGRYRVLLARAVADRLVLECQFGFEPAKLHALLAATDEFDWRGAIATKVIAHNRREITLHAVTTLCRDVSEAEQVTTLLVEGEAEDTVEWHQWSADTDLAIAASACDVLTIGVDAYLEEVRALALTSKTPPSYTQRLQRRMLDNIVHPPPTSGRFLVLAFAAAVEGIITLCHLAERGGPGRFDIVSTTIEGVHSAVGSVLTAVNGISDTDTVVLCRWLSGHTESGDLAQARRELAEVGQAPLAAGLRGDNLQGYQPLLRELGFDAVAVDGQAVHIGCRMLPGSLESLTQAHVANFKNHLSQNLARRFDAAASTLPQQSAEVLDLPPTTVPRFTTWTALVQVAEKAITFPATAKFAPLFKASGQAVAKALCDFADSVGDICTTSWKQMGDRGVCAALDLAMSGPVMAADLLSSSIPPEMADAWGTSDPMDTVPSILSQDYQSVHAAFGQLRVRLQRLLALFPLEDAAPYISEAAREEICADEPAAREELAGAAPVLSNAWLTPQSIQQSVGVLLATCKTYQTDFEQYGWIKRTALRPTFKEMLLTTSAAYLSLIIHGLADRTTWHDLDLTAPASEDLLCADFTYVNALAEYVFLDGQPWPTMLVNSLADDILTVDDNGSDDTPAVVRSTGPQTPVAQVRMCIDINAILHHFAHTIPPTRSGQAEAFTSASGISISSDVLDAVAPLLIFTRAVFEDATRVPGLLDAPSARPHAPVSLCAAVMACRHGQARAALLSGALAARVRKAGERALDICDMQQIGICRIGAEGGTLQRALAGASAVINKGLTIASGNTVERKPVWFGRDAPDSPPLAPAPPPAPIAALQRGHRRQSSIFGAKSPFGSK